MAKKAEEQAGEVPASFDADAMYDVRLKRSVPFAGRQIAAGSRLKMRGRIAAQFKGDIASAARIVEEAS
jgi:hypothetical protein